MTIRFIRVSVILLVPLVFWGFSYVLPSITKPENLRYLTAIITVLWTVAIYFLKRLNEIPNQDWLTSREVEKLTMRTAQIDKKTWRMLIVCAFCSVLIWPITADEVMNSPHLTALFVGILVGICASYLAVFPFWIKELQAFENDLKIKAATHKKRALAMEHFQKVLGQ